MNRQKGEVMTYHTLKYLVENGIGYVTLNRPEKRNALSVSLLKDLAQCLGAVARDPEVRVVIVRGEGKVFCAGHDMSEMVGGKITYYEEIFGVCVDVMEKIQGLPQPVIAQVHGVATAAGCQLVAACDLAVASDDARFGTPGVKIGLFCTTPAIPLVRAIGRKRAMEMLLTGRMISAQEAVEYGLVNKTVPVEALADETRALAEEIAEASPLTLRIGKEAFYNQVNLVDRQAYAYGKEVMVKSLCTQDAREGLGAFLEKRKPIWKAC
jgi:enoyl-CoA hydratase/carnithine racemase